MKPTHEASGTGPVERARRGVSRASLIVVLILLAVGLPLELAGVAASVAILAAATALLVLVPVVSVVAVLVEEVGRRDWPFVAAAVLVIGLVVYSLMDRLW